MMHFSVITSGTLQTHTRTRTHTQTKQVNTHTQTLRKKIHTQRNKDMLTGFVRCLERKGGEGRREGREGVREEVTGRDK